MRQIFVDMDGVVADLDGFYFELTGFPSPKSGGPAGKEFWRTVNRYTKDVGHSFYQDLPLLPDAHDLMAGIKGCYHQDPIFLTGGGNEGHPETIEGKRIWVDKYFSPAQKMICCKSSEKFTHGKPGDILIDDWTRYRHLWEGMGGHFIWYDPPCLHAIFAELKLIYYLGGGDDTVLRPQADETASDPTT